MKKIRIPIVLIALAVVALALPLVVSANHSWGKYHWNISTEQSTLDSLDLGDNLTTAEWDSSLGGASQDWNASVLKNEIVTGSGAACDPVLGGVEVCNGAYGNNGWLGIAQIWVYRGKDGHIAQGLVKMNDTYFDTPPYDTPAWRDYVVCQEVGHTFGLGHQDEFFDNANLGSCMDYTNDPGGVVGPQADNTQPNQHDYDVLAEKYAHLNGTESGGTPGGNRNGKGNKGEAPGQDVRQWGKAIGTDGKGRPNEFELTLGNGDKMITHVLWAN